MGKWFRRSTHDIVSDALKHVTIYDPHPDADDEYHDVDFTAYNYGRHATGIHAKPDEIWVKRSHLSDYMRDYVLVSRRDGYQIRMFAVSKVHPTHRS